MRYKKGMKRYAKAEGKYTEDAKGEFCKGEDGKMYKCNAPGTSTGGDTEGQADDHAHSHPDDNTDYPGAGDRGGKKKMEKSKLEKSELDSVLDEVDALSKSADPQNRKEQLLQKAGDGDLSTEERDELFKALGGDAAVDADPTFAEELIKGFEDNDTLQKSLDVSEYLDEQHGELVKALGSVAEHIEAGDRRQYEMTVTLAKAISQIGKLSKAMSERLGVLEGQPVRGPKAQGVRVPAAPNALEKGFGGEPPEGATLGKSEILDTLEEMMHKSAPDSAEANQILGATAEYEQQGTMSKAVFAQVIDFRRNNAH